VKWSEALSKTKEYEPFPNWVAPKANTSQRRRVRALTDEALFAERGRRHNRCNKWRLLFERNIGQAELDARWMAMLRSGMHEIKTKVESMSADKDRIKSYLRRNASFIKREEKLFAGCILQFNSLDPRIRAHFKWSTTDYEQPFLKEGYSFINAIHELISQYS